MPYIGNPIYQSAFVTDQFSGNGSTTAFTMSVAPAGTSNVLVVVSGVVQDPSTYGVVGTTLNFTTAPPSGTGNISCRYLGVPVTGVATTAYRTVTEFTATASQTTFTPPSYTVGYLNVYRNGVLLGSADYTATNGTTVVLATGATAGDLITTESFLVSTVLNAVPQSGGTISGNLVVTGNETVGGGSPLGGATNPVVASTGNANNYIQSYIYNTNSAGANASADFTAYPSNGADSAGWVDMGITGPNFSQAAYSVTGPNEAYLFGSAPSGSGKTGNLVYATDSTGTANAHQWYTGGFNKAKNAYGMQLDNSGNLTINGGVIKNSSGNPILKQTGSVIQTVTGTTSLFGTSTGTQVTMLEVTITPTSTTSKIIFMYSNSYCDNLGSSQDGLIYLRRGGSAGTILTNGSTGYSNYFWSAARIQVPVQGTFVDSPASTSSQTYGVYLKNSTGTCSMSGCEIVLMEVVA